jgi:hypothetical protein
MDAREVFEFITKKESYQNFFRAPCVQGGNRLKSIVSSVAAAFCLLNIHCKQLLQFFVRWINFIVVVFFLRLFVGSWGRFINGCAQAKTV